MIDRLIPTSDGQPFAYCKSTADLDPFDFHPHYENGREQRCDADLSTSRFSIARLAAGFASAALRAEVLPQSPWVNATRLRAMPPISNGQSDPDEIVTQFDQAVKKTIGDANTVAVTLSGGMDSAAVLAAAKRICSKDGRRLIAICLNSPDDQGNRPAKAAAKIMCALGISEPLIVVEPNPNRWPEPAWNRPGPRCDSEPRYHFAIAASVAEAGAEVLLHGNGADELLTSPAFLAPTLLRQYGIKTARQYLQDRSYNELEQLLAVCCGMKGRRVANLYWALRWPNRAHGRGTTVLSAKARQAANVWTDAYKSESLRVAIELKATWAQASALHALFPRDLLAPATELPEKFPFLEPDFVRYAYHIKLDRRHRCAWESGYLNSKALVMDLIPNLHTLVPRLRLRGLDAYSNYWNAMASDASTSLELGLVLPDWENRCADVFDRAIVLSTEAWLRGALEAGAIPQFDWDHCS